MNRPSRCARVVSLVAAVLLAAAASAQDRPADEILAELHAAVLPAYNVNLDAPNTNYREEFFRQRREVLLRRADLIGELHRAYPDHPAAADFLPERWETLFQWKDAWTEVFDETQALLDAAPEHPIARYARYWRALSAMRRFSTPPERDDARIIQAIDEFIARHPDDSEGPFLLFEAASNYIEDADRAVAILRRIVADHSGSPLERLAKARLRRHDEVGKPFSLEFKDAVTDADVSLASFKGRIVVIDFWATWCAPCVEAVPRLKDLYSQWQPLGVEFVGVSLDLPEEQGGLRRLKSFVEEHEIPWPQFYQGGGWESEFSSSWGVTSIPTVFVIDREGRLHATGAGDRLEPLVEALLAVPSQAESDQ